MGKLEVGKTLESKRNDPNSEERYTLRMHRFAHNNACLPFTYSVTYSRGKLDRILSSDASSSLKSVAFVFFFFPVNDDLCKFSVS